MNLISIRNEIKKSQNGHNSDTLKVGQFYALSQQIQELVKQKRETTFSKYKFQQKTQFISFLQLSIMEANYHKEFNNFVYEVTQLLVQTSTPSQNIQLQIKHAFLKKVKNRQEYDSAFQSSKLRPIILKHWFCTVNAGRNSLQHQNAKSFLNKMVSKYNCKVEQHHLLFMNCENTRYQYNCRLKEWRKITKDNILPNQIGVVYKSKHFRMNLSQKNIKSQKKISNNIKNACKNNADNIEILRFIHSFTYKVHQFYQIWKSQIFETQSPVWITKMKNIVGVKGSDIETDVKEIIFQNQQQNITNMKYEIQLRFTKAGIDFFRAKMSQKTKVIFSQAFNFINRITEKQYQKEEKELISMMESLKLSSENKEQKQTQKQKQKQKTVLQKPQKLNLKEQIKKEQKK